MEEYICSINKLKYEGGLFFVAGVFKSVARADRSFTVPSLKNSLLKLLGLLVSFEGKRHSAKRAWCKEECIEDRPIRNSLVLVLDGGMGEVLQPEGGSLNKKEDCNTPASFQGCLSYGSELCSVLLGAYDAAQPLGSAVMDEERNLVTAVLSSLLAVSQSAKNTALQGVSRTPWYLLCFYLSTSQLSLPFNLQLNSPEIGRRFILYFWTVLPHQLLYSCTLLWLRLN